MSELVANCPRCKASKTTFDVLASNYRGAGCYGWNKSFEVFSVCRNCDKSTIFLLELEKIEATRMFVDECHSFKGSITSFFKNTGYVGLKDSSSIEPPQHLPTHIETAFREGATCLAVNCFNAAGTMFRLCVDYATQDLLPDVAHESSPNSKQRRDLGLRLQWLFDNEKLPNELHELAYCLKEDGNDGAHRGTLTSADAEDLLDFTVQLLERLFTLPKRIEEATARRALRHR